MKKLPFITTLIGAILCLNTAQSQSFVSDDTKLYKKSYRGDYTTFDLSLYESYRLHLGNASSNGKELKNDKKYKRIDFTYGGTAFYSSEVKYRTGNWDGYFPNCDKYYASNNQLFYDYNIENRNKLQNPMYYEDGSFWNGMVHDKDDPGVFRFVVLDSAGNKLIDKPISPHSSFGGTQNKHPKYGSHYIYHIPVKNPSYYNPIENKDDRYYGYDQVGSYYSHQHGLELTGFFYPTRFSLGNGSVLYMEDKVGKKNFWVILIDNEIKFKLEAKPEEKPDILDLVKQVDFEVYRQDVDLAKLVSKNLKALTGYGINLKPLSVNKAGDGSALEVGQFKDGKLHGVGYRIEMLFTNRGGDLNDNLLTMKANYGLFENGIPASTRSIVVDKQDKTNNFWDISPIEGFSHIGNQPVRGTICRDYNITPIAQIEVGSEIYIESIRRTTKVHSINLTKKYLMVDTDDISVKAKIDMSNGHIFVKQDFTVNNFNRCDPTVRMPIYKEGTQVAYTVPAKFTSNSYTVNGVYYDKRVTNTSYTPAQNVYKKVTYIDGYTTQVCPLCNGTGSIANGTVNKYFWKPVQFE